MAFVHLSLLSTVGGMMWRQRSARGLGVVLDLEPHFTGARTGPRIVPLPYAARTKCQQSKRKRRTGRERGRN
ncbi:hypothetical protein BDR26DRAFT_326385 [Obelidium mucronatum]|nr:hypothetical protein BDR26DRAFT_326385 [Obelidium mucronatum]